MVRGLDDQARAKLDAELLSRPGEDAPWWWEGEEDAAASAESFARMMSRGR